jgi:hypothetical protein
MGWVWNVLLACSRTEFAVDGEGAALEMCEPLDRINEWIPHGRLVSLIEPTYAKGAGNGMDAYLFGGGYKRFDIKEFIKVVEAQDWRNRGSVQLWVNGGEEGMVDETFTLIRLRPRPKNRPTQARKPAPPSTRKRNTKNKHRRVS